MTYLSTIALPHFKGKSRESFLSAFQARQGQPDIIKKYFSHSQIWAYSPEGLYIKKKNVGTTICVHTVKSRKNCSTAL